MKICGVSLDKNNLPKKEDVFKMALNTKEFRDNPFREKEINQILDKSGLWIKEIKVVEPNLVKSKKTISKK